MEGFQIPKNFYLAPGLRSKFAKASSVTEDEAEKKIKETIINLKISYSNKDFSMISWTNLERICFRVALANYLFSGDEQDRMMYDIECYDKVVSVLPDLLEFAFSCEKLHKLISRVESFVEKLSESNRAAFGDMISAMKSWAESGKPEKINENDKVLFDILVDAKKKIPEKVNKNHHVAFVVDRLSRLDKIRLNC